jgi:hypothetical protein
MPLSLALCIIKISNHNIHHLIKSPAQCGINFTKFRCNRKKNLNLPLNLTRSAAGSFLIPPDSLQDQGWGRRPGTGENEQISTAADAGVMQQSEWA